jgi:hypothetical protein
MVLDFSDDTLKKKTIFIYLTNYLVFGKGIDINMLKVKDKT